MQRYSNNMCIEFMQDCIETKGNLAKRDLVKSYYEKYGDAFLEFLRDAMSPYIIFNIAKETIANYKRYVREDLKYEYSSISELIDFIVDKTSSDAVKVLVCSFLSSFDSDKDEFDCVSRILLRNLRIGIDIKGVNTALGFEAIESFAVQLCEPFEKEHLDEQMIIEPKLDGVRLLTVIEPNLRIKFFTRNGREVTGYDDIKMNLEKIFILFKSNLDRDGQANFAGVAIDGEIFDTDFDGTMNNLFRKSTAKSGVYNIFDIINLDHFIKRTTTHILSERKMQIEKLFKVELLSRLDIKNIAVVPYEFITIRSSFVEDDKNIMRNISAQHVKDGFEGSIIKKLNSMYKFRRTYDWQKIKPFETIDLSIDEIVEGTGKYLGMMGSVYVIHQGVRVKVGSGFSDELRKDIWDNPDKYLGEFIEIQYQDITKDKSLRFPSFKRMRHDK